MVSGQGQKLKALQVGDTLPPISLKLMNATQQSISLPDSSHKITVLEFWSPSCSFSTGEMYRLSGLQKEFEKDIAILPVGFDSQIGGTVADYVQEKQESAKPLPLATAVQTFTDTLLRRLFPYHGVPHYVWLNQSGRVLGITNDLPVNENNMQKLLRDEPVHFALKYTDTSFDTFRPLLVNGNGGSDSAFEYRSLITGYKPEISMLQIALRDSTATRIATGNTTPIGLIQMAASGLTGYGDKIGDDPLSKRLLVETPDKRFDLRRQEWLQKDDSHLDELWQQYFCYELLLPPSFSVQDAYGKMMEDMGAFFNVQASIETRKINCLELTIADKQGLPGKGGEETVYVSEDKLYYRFTNCPLKTIVTSFNNCLSIPLIRYAPKQEQRVNVTVTLTSLSDFEDIRKCMRASGLVLSPAKKKESVLVIRNRKPVLQKRER